MGSDDRGAASSKTTSPGVPGGGTVRRLGGLEGVLWLWPVVGLGAVAVVGLSFQWPAAAVAAGLLLALAGTAMAWMAKSPAATMAAFIIAAVVLAGLLSRELVKRDQSAVAIRSKPRQSVSLADIVARRKDLRGSRLSGQLAGINLHGRDLRGVHANGAVLAGAVLARAQLQGARMIATDLSGADLRNACLRGANLTGAQLRGADMRGADTRGAIGISAAGRIIDSKHPSSAACR